MITHTRTCFNPTRGLGILQRGNSNSSHAPVRSSRTSLRSSFPKLPLINKLFSFLQASFTGNPHKEILTFAGGNDAELTNILNQCVFQFFTLQPYQAAVAKLVTLVEDVEWAEEIDFDAASRTCEEQLDFSRDIIESKDFSNSLDNMIEAAKEKLSSE